MPDASFEKWEPDFAVIGRVTKTGRRAEEWRDCSRHSGGTTGPSACAGLELSCVVAIPNLKSTRHRFLTVTARTAYGASSLYHRSPRSADLGKRDHLVMGNTVKRPGGDAAVVRVIWRKGPGTRDRLHRAKPPGQADRIDELAWPCPESGPGRQELSVGAEPLALTDNMNFGNPERPEIMGEFVGAIEGMREACLALDYPVVSGNVSLYNETSGNAILPTPVIGGVGLVANIRNTVDLALKGDGDTLILIGETNGHLGCSLYLREIEGNQGGPPPPVELATERRNGDFVRDLIRAGHVAACHDLSDGGLLVAVAEMAMTGDRGAVLGPPRLGLPRNAFLFGEDQARYVVETTDPDTVLKAAHASGVPAHVIGTVAGRVDTSGCRCHIR
jgi:phosphoribosylformylglycinamidine synthase